MIAGVPYDAQIAYLESTGTQLIDTGIRGAGSGYLATTFQPLNVGSSSTYWRYFGASNGTTKTDRTIAYNSGGRTIFEDGYNQVVLGTSRGDVYTIQKTGYNVPSGSTIGDANFQIFGYNGTTNIGNVRFYSFSLWNSNDTLVRDYIPVRVGQVGYLYDRVTRKLYGNAGTGSFTLGPDVATPVMGLHRMAERSVS